MFSHPETGSDRESGRDRQWRKKKEILPLLIEEGNNKPQKLDLKPLPAELK